MIAFERGYHFDNENNFIGLSGKKLKVVIKKGYPYVSLSLGADQYRQITLHSLKAFSLYGEACFEYGIVVRHKNGNPLDWSDSNILLGTQSQNLCDTPERDRIEHAKKAASYLRKFDDATVLKIRQMKTQGFSYLEIARKFKCAKTTVYYIVKNLTYYGEVSERFNDPVLKTGGA